MDDKKETDKEPETPTSDADEGSKYETTPIIERARQEREAMEKATAEQKVENDRTEMIMAKKMLGGNSEAGQVAEKKEETSKEYSDRVMSNSK